MNRDEMIEVLKKDTCRVTFTKVNGDVRLMYCTLKEGIVPYNSTTKVHNSMRKINENVLAVWDIDTKAWRSFRLDSVTNFEVNPNGS